jgi:hypothetical protein
LVRHFVWCCSLSHIGSIRRRRHYVPRDMRV